MISLDGYARQWYKYIPAACITSLKDFHTLFQYRCNFFYPYELLFEDCYNKELKEHVFQDNHDDKELTNEECDQEKIYYNNKSDGDIS
jgi:hypothetical protein